MRNGTRHCRIPPCPCEGGGGIRGKRGESEVSYSRVARLDARVLRQHRRHGGYPWNCDLSHRHDPERYRRHALRTRGRRLASRVRVALRRRRKTKGGLRTAVVLLPSRRFRSAVRHSIECGALRRAGSECGGWRCVAAGRWCFGPDRHPKMGPGLTAAPALVSQGVHVRCTLGSRRGCDSAVGWEAEGAVIASLEILACAPSALDVERLGDEPKHCPSGRD